MAAGFLSGPFRWLLGRLGAGTAVVPTPAEVTLIAPAIGRTLTVSATTLTLTCPAITRTLTCPDPE